LGFVDFDLADLGGSLAGSVKCVQVGEPAGPEAVR